jgi:UDP-3-O-[3-hydroxymyristoyl] glucosamine N-acyltransferase
LNGVALPAACALGELARQHGGAVDESARGLIVERLVAPADAREPADLVLLVSARHVRDALGKPGPYLCTEELAERLPRGRRWVHPQANWAVARMLSPLDLADALLFPAAAGRGFVDAGAELAPDVLLGPGAVVAGGARIGSGSRICANAVIYPRVTLGQRVVIGPGAVIGRPGFGWATGPDGHALRIPQLGGVVVEDDVEIGALASVDAGTLGPTRISAGAKLDAHVHVGHNAQIGAGSLVAAQAGFAGSVVLGRGVLVGGQAGISDHVRVGDGARIAAKSGVVGDIPGGLTVAGFPAVDRWRWLRAMAALLKQSSPARRR